MFLIFSEMENHLEGYKLPGGLTITLRWFWLKETEVYILRNIALISSLCNSPNGSHLLPLKFLIQCSSAWNILDLDFLPCCHSSSALPLCDLDSHPGTPGCSPVVSCTTFCYKAGYLSDSPQDCAFHREKKLYLTFSSEQCLAHIRCSKNIYWWNTAYLYVSPIRPSQAKAMFCTISPMWTFSKYS